MSLETLCQSCGLCCDGSLFAFVSVDAEQGRALLERDLALNLRQDGTYRMPQRCAALEARRCRIYEARPTACRSYVCLLGNALEQGELSLDEALGVVKEAHDRISGLDALLPRPTDGAMNPIVRLRKQRSGSVPEPSPEIFAAWERVRSLIGRSFTGRHGLR